MSRRRRGGSWRQTWWSRETLVAHLDARDSASLASWPGIPEARHTKPTLRRARDACGWLRHTPAGPGRAAYAPVAVWPLGSSCASASPSDETLLLLGARCCTASAHHRQPGGVAADAAMLLDRRNCPSPSGNLLVDVSLPSPCSTWYQCFQGPSWLPDARPCSPSDSGCLPPPRIEELTETLDRPKESF